jgi:hypothetical protein
MPSLASMTAIRKFAGSGLAYRPARLGNAIAMAAAVAVATTTSVVRNTLQWSNSERIHVTNF